MKHLEKYKIVKPLDIPSTPCYILTVYSEMGNESYVLYIKDEVEEIIKEFVNEGFFNFSVVRGLRLNVKFTGTEIVVP